MEGARPRLPQPVTDSGRKILSGRDRPGYIAGLCVQVTVTKPLQDSDVLIDVLLITIFGQLITTLVNERQSAGEHSATFDGAGLASGIYLARLEVSDSGNPTYTATQKLVLMK